MMAPLADASGHSALSSVVASQKSTDAMRQLTVRLAELREVSTPQSPVALSTMPRARTLAGPLDNLRPAAVAVAQPLRLAFRRRLEARCALTGRQGAWGGYLEHVALPIIYRGARQRFVAIPPQPSSAQIRMHEPAVSPLRQSAQVRLVRLHGLITVSDQIPPSLHVRSGLPGKYPSWHWPNAASPDGVAGQAALANLVCCGHCSPGRCDSSEQNDTMEDQGRDCSISHLVSPNSRRTDARIDDCQVPHADRPADPLSGLIGVQGTVARTARRGVDIVVLAVRCKGRPLGKVKRFGCARDHWRTGKV